MIPTNVFLAITFAASAVFANTIKICKEPNLTGCWEPSDNIGACTNVPYDFNDQAKSIDTLGRTCTFYVDGDCVPKAPNTSFDLNGMIDDLFLSEHAHANEEISSFLCIS